MNFLLKSLFAVVLLFAGANAAYAQKAGKDPKAMAERQTARMTETLQLSPAQRQQVQTINLDFATQKSELWKANANTDRAALREKMKPLRQRHQAELKRVLTSEQWSAWEKARAEHKGHKKGKHGKNKTGKA